MDPAMWGMILGKSGKLPGSLAPEIIELAKEKNMEFYTDDPQALYPNELPKYIAEMEQLGWDRGQDDEELFEFAMHEKQYREYKSGLAKEQFNQDWIERMRKAGKPIPESLLPKQPEISKDDELAAVAMALHMAQKQALAPAATLPVIRSTAWKRFNPYKV